MDKARETEIMSMLFYQQLLRNKIIELEKRRVEDGYLTDDDQELLKRYVEKLIEIDNGLGK